MHLVVAMFGSVSRMKLFAQRGARIRIRAMLQQQLRERRDLRPGLIIHPEIRLGYDGVNRKRPRQERSLNEKEYDNRLFGPLYIA